MSRSLPVPIPTLTTPRLVLRGHVAADLDACAAMWADDGVTRHIGGRAFTREESWSKLLRYAGHWQILGYGYWAVVDAGSGQFVGEVGFADFKRELQPSIEGTPEMGWVLAPWAHGRGLATEAVLAALSWHDERTGGARTACLIDEGNGASRRVADKAGYRLVGPAVYKGSPTMLFARDTAPGIVGG